ncbi:uncharacterized protein LOC110466710 [Mizuhopecten yessoensis]|uniref:uncharacterized protein LOC110466710 n=1 Tax=Mizuhopecten yessoensis TaxID=6573 RepID=UPI000B45A492|nr:uncharacterized protein LOC110466710 [Mizuhopecten yessoensis]
MEVLISKSIDELASDDVQSIQEATTGQSDNHRWTEMRKGRITASNFHAVDTKVCSYEKKVECDVKPLIKNIMGYTTVNPNVKSLKYGREMEPVAKKDFLKLYCKHHRSVIYSECGLFVDKRHPFLGASPDLLLSCSCCGEGLLEIKCPMVKKCEVCSSFCTCNLPNCLTKTNPPTLKKLGYYAQIQGQMALTNRKWCVFFVYTCNGSHNKFLLT